MQRLNYEIPLDRVSAPMKKTLCFLVIALSVCVYPVFLRVPIEITRVFGLIEIDMFSWYRMWLIVIIGTAMLIAVNEAVPINASIYWLLLVISTANSAYFRTALFGAPWTHEGLLAIVGYLGLYLAARKYGLFKELEACLDAVIVIAFLFCILQMLYGNFAFFPILKWLFPHLGYEVTGGPLYSSFGHWNHLGLFCSLFYPYALLKRKWALTALILFMAIGCMSRGAWVSIGFTSILMGRQAFRYAVLAAVLIAIPFRHELSARVMYTLRDRTLSGRTYIWKKSLPEMKHTIFIGTGSGAYAMYFPQREYKEYYGQKVVDRPHSLYLSTWINSGLISLIVLTMGISIILFKGMDSALKMGAIGFLVCGLFTDSVLSVTPYFVIFLGCLSYRKDWRLL